LVFPFNNINIEACPSSSGKQYEQKIFRTGLAALSLVCKQSIAILLLDRAQALLFA
jgi:hypothetical protein